MPKCIVEDLALRGDIPCWRSQFFDFVKVHKRLHRWLRKAERAESFEC